MGVEHALPEVPKGGVDRELVGHVDGLPLVYGVGAQVRIKLTITEDTTSSRPDKPLFLRRFSELTLTGRTSWRSIAWSVTSPTTHPPEDSSPWEGGVWEGGVAPSTLKNAALSGGDTFFSLRFL